MEPLEKTQDKIADIMARHGVVLGYVFGSYARDEMTPLSDVDVAVMFSPSISSKNQFSRELKLADDIGHLLHIERVDVVNLSSVSSPLLKHRAALCGRVVLAKSQTHRRQVERLILQEYEDTQHLRDANAYFLDRRLNSSMLHDSDR
jgi:predicted nucleotidyltransferase